MTLREEAQGWPLASEDAGSTTGAGVGVTADEPPSDYQERKESGWCTYSSACPRRAEGWPDPTHQLCSWHRMRVNARQRRRVNAARAANREQGKCRTCGVPSDTYRCPACVINDGAEIPTRGASGRVDAAAADKAARIAAATKVDPSGRTRYHGHQKRGNQPHAELNQQDVEMAIAAFERWKMGVLLLATEEVRGLPAVQRQAAKDAVCLLGDRVGGIIDVVADRLGHFKAKHGKRDGE